MRAPLSLAVLALVLSACGSQPPAPEQKEAKVEERAPAKVVQPEPRVEPPRTVEVKDSFDPNSIAALRDPRSPLSRRSIYFDYDSFTLKDEYQALVGVHGKFLTANPKMKMLIQGNADERGSREYNLALGQKRADAVKKALSLVGVKDDQMESVSLGKEKPVCEQSTEECWTKNRRGDMLYSGEF